MKEEKCRVIENLQINNQYYLIKLEAPYIATHSLPGNFVMTAVSTTHDPLLKRPFGIFMAEPPYIWLYYQVVGRGTELLAHFKKDDTIIVLGPLGNSFPGCRDKNILLIAGGRGFGPIHYACRTYTEPTRNNRVYLIYGARSATDLNLLDMLKDLSTEEYFLYTDDGSAGKKGFVTSDIQNIVKQAQIQLVASCGPHAMFQALHKELSGFSLEHYVSLEAIMGCGIGICYSCAVETTTGGYKKVCSDGPVFKMEDIVWKN